MSLVVVLSGPARTRAHAQLALVEAGFSILNAQHPQAHAHVDWSKRLPMLPSGEEPKAPHEFLSVIADDVNAPVALVEPHKWVLRIHYATPDPPKRDQVAATLDEMRREIAELKAKVG